MAMSWDKARGPTQIALLGIIALALVGRVLWPKLRQPPRPPKPAAAFVHPIVPSPPVVNAPPPNCRARDLQMAAAAVRELRAAATLAKARRPPTNRPPTKGCREQPETRAMQAHIDMVAQGVGACVARDAELDGAWNLVQSAVVTLRTCADCAESPAVREKNCARTTDLLSQADTAPP